MSTDVVTYNVLRVVSGGAAVRADLIAQGCLVEASRESDRLPRLVLDAGPCLALDDAAITMAAARIYAEGRPCASDADPRIVQRVDALVARRAAPARGASS